MTASAKRAVAACALLAGASLIALNASTAAYAAETVTYQYDARGRLTQVSHAGGPANGTVAAYDLDAADNRTNLSISRTPARVVVVPLNGFQVIVLPPPT